MTCGAPTYHFDLAPIPILTYADADKVENIARRVMLGLGGCPTCRGACTYGDPCPTCDLIVGPCARCWRAEDNDDNLAGCDCDDCVQRSTDAHSLEGALERWLQD